MARRGVRRWLRAACAAATRGAAMVMTRCRDQIRPLTGPGNWRQGKGLSVADKDRPIVVIGEILVEIMADTQGQGFDGPMALTGPYPSGAPAIFASQVARLGQACGIISAVGDDDFGRLNIARLAADGVDVTAVSTDPDRPTGSAFVRYRPDGARDFVFNIRHSACAMTALTPAADALLARCGHLHVMGSSLSSEALVAANLEAIARVKGQGGTVSFDPNLRAELLDIPGLRAAMRQILQMCDLYLPSGAEVTLLTDAQDEAGAVAEVLGLGVQAVVHKLGAAGVRCSDHSGSRFQPAFAVTEVDPTGAGDCFGAAFVTFWRQGKPVATALRLAAAAGALAVTRRGPMEGAAWLAELEAFAGAGL